jgi:hypothetical protein
MADTAMWARRVGEWQRSGLTTAEFCAGREFTAGGLRYWTHRLRKEGAAPAPASTTVVRVARVRRVPTVAKEKLEGAQLVGPSAPAGETPIVVELGAARVSVRSGFDRATLASVMEVIAVRGGVS